MDERPPSSASPALERYRDGPPPHPRTYPDLHEHVLALAREGLLVIVDEPINKDTEMHPLVRWQYRGGIAEPRAQGVPVHAADRLQGPALRHLGAGRRPGGQPRRLSGRFRQAARKIGATWVKRHRQSDSAARWSTMHLARRWCGSATISTGRPRARRAAGADLDAGLGQRALSLRRPLHHQGSRTAESRTSATIAGSSRRRGGSA